MKLGVAVLLRCLAFSLLLCSQVGAVALAATTQVERYDDWELTCTKPPQKREAQFNQNTDGDYSAMRCRLQQAQAIAGGTNVAFPLNFVVQKEQTLAIISTPLNVYLPAGLDLKVDTRKTRRAAFETCNLTGCHSGFVVDQAMLSALRNGKSLLVTVRNSKSTQIPIHASLKGISDGLDALKTAPK